MIAGRRARKRTLIRSGSMNSIMARTMSPSKGWAKPNPEQKNARQDGVTAFQMGPSSEVERRAPLIESASQPEVILYLRQLSTLHTAGVLTDDEYSAARNRLFGS